MRRKCERLVLKFGSGTLARASGASLERQQFLRLAREVAALMRNGRQCIIVSSGAVAAGMSVLALKERPNDLATIQACAAVGQSKLMREYETAFSRYKLHVAQLLLTHSDLDSRTRHANARNTLERLLERGSVVPIINENDSVAVEELRFGDNDRLSAEVAMLAHAGLLIMLTSVNGLMDASGAVVPRVTNIDEAERLVRSERGKFSVGGMTSKLQAARMATSAGIPTVIANGRKAGLLEAILAGEAIGTRFVTHARR